jgi:hypothetical protein
VIIAADGIDPGGALEVRSAPGAGATVTSHLPAANRIESR